MVKEMLPQRNIQFFYHVCKKLPSNSPVRKYQGCESNSGPSAAALMVPVQWKSNLAAADKHVSLNVKLHNLEYHSKDTAWLGGNISLVLESW